MRRQLVKFYIIFSFIISLGFVTCGYSQITISTPAYSFSQACASPSFNNYNFSFSFFPPSGLGPGNQFIVEMSDAAGSFASPVILTTLTNTSSPVSGSFAVPTDVNGTAYRIRVRSTNPVKVSPPSAPFAAHYAVHNQPYAINSNVGTVYLCEGDTYTLSIDDTGTSSSPLYYPELTYIWYKDYDVVPGETGSTLTVSEAGAYYVVTDYGSCVMNSYSNIVTINVQPPLTPVIESEGGETTICPTDTIELTSLLQDPGYTYAWYKDDVVITGAESEVYTAAEDGVYHLEITSAGCTFESNTITLDSNDFDLVLDPSAAISIIPGETITLTAITDAVSPVIEWYKDDVLITGESAITYDITEPGDYKVIINQPTPCNITKEASVTVSYPVSFDLMVAPDSYTSCVSASTNLMISQFDAELLSGTVSLVGNSYGYDYQWYKDGVPVTGATGTSLSVTNPSQNGDYQLTVTLPGYGTVSSNTLTIDLGMPTPAVSGDTVYCEGDDTLLSSDVTDIGYTYQWYKDDVAIAGADASSYEANEEGDYYLTVTGGNCTVQSNTLAVSQAAITINSTDPVLDIILPGEVKTLTVTTDADTPAYSWTKDGVALSETSDTLTATQDGEYVVTVTQTVGCGAVETFTFTLEYPTGFDVTIAPSTGYTACTSTNTTLSIANFTSETPSGTVPMADLGYSYQWFKDGIAVPGAAAQTLNLISAAENGDYYLEITMPDFAAIVSNTLTINLAVGAVTISGDTNLCEGGTTVLSSSLTASEYTYQWYMDDVAIAGATTSDYTSDAEGNYKVEVSNGTCTTESNTLTLTTETITINSTDPVLDIILPGEVKTLTVTTDADTPAYSWTKDGMALSETSDTLTATQDGEYEVTVTQTVGCGAVETFTFTLEYPTGFDVTIAPSTGYTACTSTNTTLSIANFTAETPSGTVPMADLGYSYQWFKDGIAVPGATAQTLNLTSAAENGDYYLEITMPDFAAIVSNTVTINLAVGAVTISGDTNLCEGGTIVLSSSLTASEYTYQWYMDDVAIAGATTSDYTADAEGDYKVEVSNGNCTTESNTLTLTTETITINSTDPVLDIILPGEVKTLTVTTDADTPTYSWTRNGVALSETSGTLTATQDGEYVVTVTQTVGCGAVETFTFTLEYPTGFDVTIAPGAGYTACTSTNTTLSIANFTADTPSGTVPMADLGYSYQWFKDGIAVLGATAQTLNLTSAAENGDYYLEITMPDFAAIVSNTLTINLAVGAVTISGDTNLCEGGTTVLSSSLTVLEYTYQWYMDDVAIAGATASDYTADAEGDYKVEVSNGTCTTESNTLTLTTASITISSSNPAVDIILPGENKVIAVSTDADTPTYSWTRDGYPLTETSGTLTATQDGEYVVTVTQTVGCPATAQMTFTLGYPTGFTITIAPGDAYLPCIADSTTLDITSFIAITFAGNIPMTDLGYSYQWFKDGDPVPGATLPTLTLNNASQNGSYRLQVIMPGFSALLSNTVSVNLSIGNVDIVASGQLCPENPSVEITSSVTDPSYSYEWFKDAVSVSTGNSPSYTVTEPGEYHVEVSDTTCSYVSNMLNIEESDFNLTPDNPFVDIIIPGENKVLSVTTDALLPTFMWYKDDVAIPGGNSASLYADTEGVYKVVVTQTQDCNIVKELTYELIYPSGFDIDIAPSDEFAECSDVSAQLNISQFNALTPSGPIDILGNDFGYDYQWYHEGAPVAGATSVTYNAVESGMYHLEVTIPDFGAIQTNTIAINLGFVPEVVISTEDIFCASDSEINITSNVNDSAYTYEWYMVGSNTVIGNASSVTVTEAGSYFLEVTFENCTIASNVLEIIPYDMSQVTLSSGPELELPEGTTETITAGGAESYEWYFNGTIVSNGPTVEVTQEGLYTVIATIGECEEIREVLVKLVENTVIAIPNAITVNNDGYNDKWALPVKYVNKDNIEIVIYGPDGTIVYRASNYMNNWPESDFMYSKKNPVYYYTIMEDNEITKRGSITIIE